MPKIIRPPRHFQFCTQMNRELHRRFREACVKEHCTMADALDLLVREYIEAVDERERAEECDA